MFCIKCGHEVSEHAFFCGKCGHALNNTPKTDQESDINNTVSSKEEDLENTEIITQECIVDESVTMEKPDESLIQPKKPFKFKPIYAVIAGVLIVALTGAFFGGMLFFDWLDYRKTMTEASNAVTLGDYDRAFELYRDALANQPDNEAALESLNEAQVTALEEGLLDAKKLVADGRAGDALDLFSKLPFLKDDEKYEEFITYLDMLKTNPKMVSIDSSAFPEIIVYIDISGGVAIAGGDISLYEGGREIPPSDVTKKGGEMAVTYIAEDSSNSSERRSISLTLSVGEFAFPLSGDYITPVYQDADITLVSTDFSDYPMVHAFFRVEDAVTEQPVTNLRPSSFTISESVSGGNYIAREIKSAETLVGSSGKYGINIALVADKSDSIGSDLAKIKTVMREFVGSLALSGGDRAELIAFDDVPQLMCTFTNDQNLLYNGINNMETDGMTAFYDAVYQGVRNAALRGGARCVIAFTDGEDNMSKFTANDVVRFANEKQVPLYIIGVGNSFSFSQNTLKNMADQTQGYYWYIDDLYDLREIYTQIYSGLQELYVVSYESDASEDALAQRGLDITMRGVGYKGNIRETFTPAKTASGSNNGSRYEIFVGDVSWEEANEHCLERGGHLVTITSKAEEDEIIALAESKGAIFVWLGGYTSYDYYNNVFAHWITGEDFMYENWMTDEPSRHDLDGTPEWYLMLWYVKDDGGWSWNDQRNNPLADFPYYKGKIAYVCEYE